MSTNPIASSIHRPSCSRRAPVARLAARAALATLAALAAPASARAQPAPARAQPAPAPAPAPKGELEVLVPPQGSAAEVPLHAGTVCILVFPEKLASQTMAGSGAADFELQPWNESSVAVRPTSAKAAPATLALVTTTGLVRVNVTLRVVPASEPALTLVRFKAASAAEAFEAQVQAEIERRVAPIRKRLAREQQELDTQIRRGADRMLAEQILRRSEILKLKSHARNDDHVIIHVWRAALLGDDAYLAFQIENRSGSPYPLASVRVLANGRNVAGGAYLPIGPAVRDPALIGVVASGATASAVVVVPLAQALLRRPLTLEISKPDGRGIVRADHGIELR
jgi:hypothetical protein